jgi:predicted enzyme related to lactoylglutathione lyase
MDHTIVHFEIPADQPERAARFYRELFGWEIGKWEGSAEEREGMEYRPPAFEYWMVRTVPTDAEGRPTRPGVNGGLMKRMFPGQTPVNYVGVEDVDDFARRAEKLGAKVIVPKRPVPGMGWFAQLTDTEGNVFAIWQMDPKAGQEGEPASAEVGNAGR